MTTVLVPFEFRTKAQNLLQLQGRLTRSQIVDIAIITVAQWQDDRESCRKSIRDQFAPAPVIVRSSASDEDSERASMAGAFASCADIDSLDASALAGAIDSVVASYQAKLVHRLADQEILIQPMVSDVVASGVVFTRDLGHNLPYLVINYEESARTDSITAGTRTAPQKTFRVFRDADTATLFAPLAEIVGAAHEVETATGCTTLDIEFAIDEHDVFYLLQVRPLVRTRVVSQTRLDRRLTSEIEAMKALVVERFRRRPGLYGKGTALGEMPDWNPAEIIGTHPTPLAVTLYRYLIMDSVWREARGHLGYRDPAPHSLLVEVGGRPYVDVRCSFNSLLPQGLPDGLAEQLIDHYVDRLRAHPELHDKVEFEIVLSSHTFDVEPEQRRLREAGFSDADLDDLWKRLLHLTDTTVRNTASRTLGFEADVARLTNQRDSLLSVKGRIEGLPFKVQYLLEDCRSFGTLPSR